MLTWARSSDALSPWPTTIMSQSFHALGPDSAVVLDWVSESMRRRMPAHDGFIGPSMSPPIRQLFAIAGESA